MKILHFLALLVLGLATVPGAQAAVLAGPITNAANAHTYFLLSHTNWAASEAQARQLGGHLVTINDAAENQWILNTFSPLTGVPESRLWIGLNDTAIEGEFVWASGEPVTFTNWYPGEPNNLGPGGEDYAAIIQSNFAPPDDRWLDITDQNVSPFTRTFGIVEVPMVVTQTADQWMPGSLRLNGLANPNGSPTLAWFEWGASTAYGNTTSPRSVGSGTNYVGFSAVVTGLVSAAEYHFRARGSNASGFAAGQDRTFTLRDSLPGVTTLAADQLAPTSARLNGQANPKGWPTVAWFEWGTSTAYGNTTPPQSVGSSSGLNVGFSNVLTGLVNGTVYHFRTVASNAFGLAADLDQTFYLANLRPIVTTLAADQLITNSARLRGQVNSQGWPTTAWFEWGTNTTYGNVIGMQDIGQAAGGSNLTVVLNGLTVGPSYRYRLVASNVFGAAYGAEQTFNLYPPPITKTWTGADSTGLWSAPGNWSPAGVPANGDDLVFPGGLPPGDMATTNDLADGSFRSIRFQAGGHTIHGHAMTLMNRNDVIVNSGTNVIACDLTFSGTPSNPTSQFPSIRGSTFTSGELTVIGNVGGGSLWVSMARLVITGQFTGDSVRSQFGNLDLHGDNPSPVSAAVQNAATLHVQGSQPNLNIAMLWEFESASCPSLSGDGVVGDVTGCGDIILDSTLSVKSLGGRGASQNGSRRLNIRLNGTNVGEYGRLISSGDVILTYGRLSASPGFNPQPGQVFTVVDKTSPGPMTTLPGYDPAIFGPEGTIITLNGAPLRLSYVGGDGNDVTLTVATPTPIVLNGIQRPFDTQSVFSYSAGIGLRYAVERSATLTNWTTLRTDTANTNPMTVTDTAATNRMNFYRVRLLPNP